MELWRDRLADRCGGQCGGRAQRLAMARGGSVQGRALEDDNAWRRRRYGCHDSPGFAGRASQYWKRGMAPYRRVGADAAFFLSSETDLRLAWLRRDKWKSGDVARLVDAVGSNQGIAAGARSLWEKPFKDRSSRRILTDTHRTRPKALYRLDVFGRDAGDVH